MVLFWCHSSIKLTLHCTVRSQNDPFTIHSSSVLSDEKTGLSEIILHYQTTIKRGSNLLQGVTSLDHYIRCQQSLKWNTWECKIAYFIASYCHRLTIILIYISNFSVSAFYKSQLLTISQLTASHPVHLGGLVYFQELTPERNNSYAY